MNVELGIELYSGTDELRQGIQFDIAYVIQRLRDTFSNIAIEEEYFQRQVERVRAIVGDSENKGALRIAIRDAEERGPRFGFTVYSASRIVLKGGVNRHCLSFRFDKDTVDSEIQSKVEEFLASFALKRYCSESLQPDNPK